MATLNGKPYPAISALPALLKEYRIGTILVRGVSESRAETNGNQGKPPFFNNPVTQTL